VAAIAGVVLAAGGGRRMGRPKALVELDGQPLVVRAQAVLRDGRCHPVAVVTGAGHDQVAPLVDGPVVHNAAWADGQAGSARAALDWAGGAGVDAVVVLPVDTPGIPAAVVDRLIAGWRGAPDRAAVATYDGRMRNPVLLPAPVWAAVRVALSGDAGAGHWLRAHPDRVVAVDCTGLGDPTDLDTPADLQRWQARLESGRRRA
jgi:CTP:molybdopterin cytidylyltransferase MocA